jgi:hypothetical protein
MSVFFRRTVLPTSQRGARCLFFVPGGRPGPGRWGFGARAGQGMVARTGAGVSRSVLASFSHECRRSRTREPGEPKLGVGGDDQPGPAVGRFWFAQSGPSPAEGLLRTDGRCVPGRKRRRNAFQTRSTSSSEAPVLKDHSQPAGASRSFDRCSTLSRIKVPSISGSSPSCSSQAARCVSRGWIRSQACARPCRSSRCWFG